jgi:hypothetical protein
MGMLRRVVCWKFTNVSEELSSFRNRKVPIRQANKQIPWPLFRKRTIPTERPPLVDEI